MKYFSTLLILPLLGANIYANDVENEIQNLKDKITTLNQKIDNLNKSKGSLELKSKSTILTVGGRIQFLTTYASPETGFLVNNVPLSSNGDDGLSMTARDSRLWVKTKTPSTYGWIRSTIEIDFWGKPDATNESTTNSYLPRMRHAYVEFNGFTFGQANSAFNSDAPLDTINDSFNFTFVRQPLIRYTIQSGKSAYDISLEQPETTLLDQNATMVTPQDDVMPDIILKARYYPAWGETSLAIMGRYITQDNYITNTKDSKPGWAANYSALIKVFELDDISLDAQYGLGLGRYLAYNPYPAGTIDAKGNIKLQPSYGGHIGYRHWWSKKIKSTLGYSYSATKNNADILNAADKNKATKSASSLQLNLLYAPVKDVLTGFEYSYGVRNIESSQTGYLNIVNFMFRYDF